MEGQLKRVMDFSFVPEEVRQRFSSNDKLSDDDRKMILQVANKYGALTRPVSYEEFMGG